FKVYYGDGTRLDILRAAGAGTADIILICIDNKEAAVRIADLVRDEFPLARVMARAFDRGHAIELVKAGVDYQIREVFESALTFGGTAIRLLGASDSEAEDVVEGVRDRDQQRFELQLAGEDWRNLGQLLISNAQDQAREGGVAVDPREAEEEVAKSTTPA